MSTKEIFWINHEIARILKVGGHFILGVPNVAAFHNRIRLFWGKHPSQSKSYSAHVRCFSKDDTLTFYQECFPGGYDLAAFYGCQFYPFPKHVARFLASSFPSLAHTIFFVFRKNNAYDNQFLEYPQRAQLETNFKIA